MAEDLVANVFGCVQLSRCILTNGGFQHHGIACKAVLPFSIAEGDGSLCPSGQGHHSGLKLSSQAADVVA